MAGMWWTEDWKRRLQPPAPQRLHPPLARGHPTHAGTYVKNSATASVSHCEEQKTLVRVTVRL